MKTRQGFVSNSSSSNFIVAFPEEPKNVKHIQKMMFGDRLFYPDCWDEPEDKCNICEKRFTCLTEEHVGYSTELIADNIYKDIYNVYEGVQKPNVLRKLIDALDEGHRPEYPAYDYTSMRDMSFEDTMKYINKRQQSKRKIARKLVKEFMAKNPGAYIYVFKFSDENGPFWSFMEHQDVFVNLPHMSASCH